MKVTQEIGKLILKDGLLSPVYEIEIDLIKRWSIVAEENGATYYSFHLPGSIQNVSVSSKKADDLKYEIDEISKILNIEPDLDISESRLSVTDGLIAVDVGLSIPLLAALIGSS
ncbi:hypothetical protein [Pleionea sediminis]|uniref:hypothetical protein n=1 Tax=Pleionea sediminis TaxID=2569479 RepID=UPI001185A92D|nr:hypothetical protein [Pleionea sediminis]